MQNLKDYYKIEQYLSDAIRVILTLFVTHGCREEQQQNIVACNEIKTTAIFHIIPLLSTVNDFDKKKRSTVFQSTSVTLKMIVHAFSAFVVLL